MINNDKEYLKAYSLRQRMKAQLRFGNPTQEQINTWLDEEPNLTKALEVYEIAQKDYERKGGWIPTISGRRFWLLSPRASDIFPADIVYSLARLPRYNSLTLGEIYSIGQHSWMGAQLIEPQYKLHFSLHDGSEFIAQDIITPLKRELGAVYYNIESKIQDVISEAFGLEWTEEAHRAVKEIDNRMLITEINSLTPYQILCNDLPCLGEEIKITPMYWKDVYYRLRKDINEMCGENTVCSLEDLLSGQV